MKHFGFSLSVILLGIFCQQVNATTIHVPADSATIQGAVNGAEHGDTVLVAPGVYNENVDCSCKAVLLASHYLLDHDTLTIDSTIIDGEGGTALSWDGAVCFPEDESLAVVGFSIRNSYYGVSKYLGWWENKPKSHIHHNRFLGNYCGAFSVTWGRCVIDHNIFVDNQVGVECYGDISKNTEKAEDHLTIVENNAFLYNSEVGAIAWGGAYHVFRSNIFWGNKQAIRATYYSSLNAVGNVICNNSTGIFCWGGIAHLFWVTVENNIIAINDTGICISGLVDSVLIRHNDAWSNQSGDFIGCPAGTGDTTWGTNFNGTSCDAFYNIMRDPLFADTIDFGLLCNSPCIDAGDSAAQVPDTGGYRIDIGKNEFHYLVGDASGDHVVDIGDVIFSTNHVFIGGAEPCPFHSGDVNFDGVIDVSDVVCLINYLFLGDPFPFSI